MILNSALLPNDRRRGSRRRRKSLGQWQGARLLRKVNLALELGDVVEAADVVDEGLDRRADSVALAVTRAEDTGELAVGRVAFNDEPLAQVELALFNHLAPLPVPITAVRGHYVALVDLPEVV